MPRPCLNEESGTARRVPRSHDHHRGYVLSPRQIVTRAERIVDHMGPSRPSASGLGVPAVPFVPSDGKADEVSAIPGQFHIPKQIGNLPHKVRSSWPGRRPVPAGRPNVACTCDGGSPAPAPPQHLRTPPRDAPGPCPRPASMGSPSLFPGGENLSRAEGVQRVRLSETPVTLMHVHLG